MILEVLDRISAIPKYILEHTCLKRQLIELLKPGRVPRHIGFIMDGNRRFAKERGLPTRDGHRAGTRALIHALESCFEIGIKEVSIYAFSIENFNRPKEEVDDILNLLKDNIKKISEKSIIQKHKVRFRIVGNKDLIEPSILADLERIEDTSKTDQTTKFLNVCFAYTARDEIARSIQQIATKRGSQCMSKTEITERVVVENLDVGGLGMPLDVLVRTSGHTRLSDFLLWQCSSNCKIVFLDTLWPSFRFWELYTVLMRWSFEQTIVHSRHAIWGVPASQKVVSIRSLPACPPFASVSKQVKPTPG